MSHRPPASTCRYSKRTWQSIRPERPGDAGSARQRPIFALPFAPSLDLSPWSTHSRSCLVEIKGLIPEHGGDRALGRHGVGFHGIDDAAVHKGLDGRDI